jgi:predicted amidohydrolase YtcJ
MMLPRPRPPVPRGPADVVLYNGNVITMDPRRPSARGVAIADGRIMAVGDDRAVRDLAGPRTEQVDLADRTLLPGFVDSHAHVSHVGEELAKVDLSRCRSIADVLEAVGERARQTPPGEWVQVSAMWHETALAERRFPTRHELDAVAPNNPVYLPRGTRFFAVANSRALDLAGIDERTPDPDGGRFERDPRTGELTGLLLQPAAFGRVRRLLPAPSPDHHVEAIRRGGRLFSRAGVTSVVDPALTPEVMRAYQRVWAAGELQVRTNMTLIVDRSVPLAVGAEELVEAAETWGLFSGHGDDLLRLGALKVWADGFIETAWLKEGYANDASFHGVQAMPRETLERFTRAASRQGWQVAIHSVGDAAVELVLDAFEAADRERPIGGRRWSLMHALFMSPTMIERARRLGVVVSAQQLLVYAFAPTAIECWGDERMSNVSPHRTWLDAGLVVAAGSDVVPFDPLLGIWSLVTRRTLAAGVVGPGQRVSREEALRMYTLNGAYLTFDEELKGSLEPGKLADLVILDGDLMTCPEDEIKDLPVVTTVLGGRVVHSDGRVWGDRTDAAR